MENMRFKVGDRVRIKSLEWYNENKDEYGYIDCGSREFFTKMSNWCGKIATIKEICKTNCYHLEEYDFDWTDEMIEGLVEEEAKPKFKVGDKVKWYNHTCNITSIDTDENTYIYLIRHDDYREDKIFAKWVPENELTFEDEEETKPIDFTIKATDTKGKVEVVIPEGYDYEIENDKLYFITKKTEYPKTYEECCKVLGLNHYLCLSWSSYDVYSGVINCLPKRIEDIAKKLESLSKLLICRDAYWKIAGDEMGLGEPWIPVYQDDKQDKHCIYVDIWGVTLHQDNIVQHVLSFPTEEMRDAFYENFKKEIEFCKELL